VLPTPVKTFRPDQPNNSAAGVQVRPLIQHYSQMQILMVFFKDSQYKTVSTEKLSISMQNQTTKKFGPFFRHFFGKSAKTSTPDFQRPTQFFRSLKGTVSRDFRPLVFFTNQPHLGP
jgi:hypothetical protein